MSVALVVLATAGIICVPVGLFVALRMFARFPQPRPVRAALPAPMRADLRRVAPRRLELTAGDGSHIIEAR